REHLSGREGGRALARDRSAVWKARGFGLEWTRPDHLDGRGGAAVTSDGRRLRASQWRRRKGCRERDRDHCQPSCSAFNGGARRSTRTVSSSAAVRPKRSVVVTET